MGGSFLSLFSVHLLTASILWATFSCPCVSSPMNTPWESGTGFLFSPLSLPLKTVELGPGKTVGGCKCSLPSLAMIFWSLKPAWRKKKTTVVLRPPGVPSRHFLLIHTQNKKINANCRNGGWELYISTWQLMSVSVQVRCDFVLSYRFDEL